MLFDEEKFEEFKTKIEKLGYNKVLKISAATKQGVDDLMKEAARLLSIIPVTELEISAEDRL